MVLYVVTVNVKPSVEADWVRWMREEHIPAVLDTGYFEGARFHRVVEPLPGGAAAFEIHYALADLDHLRRYQAEAAPALKRDHEERYGAQVSASRRVLRAE